jgi:UPF0176 protein
MTAAEASRATARGPILNVSFYRFVELQDLDELRSRLKARAIEQDLKGSILLSEEGINGFLAAPPARLRPFLEWLFRMPPFRGMEAKESFSSEVPFARMLVKVKKEIIAMGRPEISPAKFTGKRLAPAELKHWYDTKKDFVIVDTRNDYEVTEGTFKNAVHYDIETFREFPEKFEKEAEALREKTVVMFCTGGIRCEKATALAMDLGVTDVYQLEGGILKYFEEVGPAHYRGECFVFDHRTNVDAGLEPREERRLREKAEGLRFYGRRHCAFSARVRMALDARGLPYAFSESESGNVPSDILKIAPQAESPVLVHSQAGQEDLVLYRSAIILDYLEEKFPELRKFQPETAERRARMRLWIDWIDGPFARDSKDWIAERDRLGPDQRYALEAKLEKHLYRLKTPLQRSRRFLVVDAPTQADLAAYSVLAPLRAAGFPTEYAERFTPVWEWFDRVGALATSPTKAKSPALTPDIPSRR